MRRKGTGARTIVLCAALLAGANVSAGENVGPRKIANLGCHNIDGTCYVTLEGSSFGATLGCPSGPTTQFRFDNADIAAGQRAYASFLSAYLSGKQVYVFLEGCSIQGWPRLVYFFVLD